MKHTLDYLYNFGRGHVDQEDQVDQVDQEDQKDQVD